MTNSTKIKISLFVISVLVIFTIFLVNRIIISNVRIDSRIQVEKIAVAYSEVIHKEDGDIPNFLNIFLPTINFPLVITFNNEFYGHNNHTIFKNKSKNELDALIEDFIKTSKNNFEPLPIMFNKIEMGKIHYGDPKIINQLKWLPYFEIGFTLLILCFAYYGFRILRISENNQIWIGMARETAHQLGTPISSIFGWLKLLEDDSINKNNIYNSIEEDVNRLSEISDRFYKIGITPKLVKIDIVKILQDIKRYYLKRISNKSNVKINLNFDNDIFNVDGDIILLNWAIENIIKNSLDATNYMNSMININIVNKNHNVIIDIIDNGKGIARKNWKKIFEPGFSSKEKGWGLGLSLTKRIIEDLHYGKISVISSNSKSTNLQIVLNKSKK